MTEAIQSTSNISPLYPWHQRTWLKWRQRFAAPRGVNALLLYGPAHSGKRSLARRLAQGLLCQTPEAGLDPCGHCPSCGWFSANTHPDFLSVEVEENSSVIKIDQIRELGARMALTSHTGGRKIGLICAADCLNTQAANGLLKTLEEPTAGTIYILVTSEPGALPLTLRSRCQKEAVFPEDPSSVQQWLSAEGLPPTAFSTSLNREMLKSPLFLRDLHTSGFTAILADFELSLIELARGVHRIGFSQVVEQWCKQDLGILLFFWTHWIETLIRFKLTLGTLRPAREPTPRFVEELNPLCELTLLFSMRDQLIQARQSLRTALNRQMLMESLLLLWVSLKDTPSEFVRHERLEKA